MMSHEPSKAANDRIQSLAARAGVDDTTRRELADHLHDKLDAYLTGREKLSEADAMILVERHFGDLAALRGRLGDVHGGGSWEELFRRTAAVLLATLAAGSLVMLFSQSVHHALNAHIDWVLDNRWVFWFVNYPPSLIYVGTIWALAWSWKRQLARGRRPWWQRVRPITLLLICLVFTGVCALAPQHWRWQPQLAPTSLMWMQFFAQWYGWWSAWHLLEMFLTVWAWFWWCEVSWRRWRSVVAVATGWAVLILCSLSADVRWGMSSWPKMATHLYLCVGWFLIMGSMLTVLTRRRDRAAAT